MVEAQLAVARRVAEEVYRRALDVGIPGPRLLSHATIADGIDWNAYLKEYIEELTEKEAKVEEKAGPGPILLDSDPEQPTIFGGG